MNKIKIKAFANKILIISIWLLICCCTRNEPANSNLENQFEIPQKTNNAIQIPTETTSRILLETYNDNDITQNIQRMKGEILIGNMIQKNDNEKAFIWNQMKFSCTDIETGCITSSIPLIDFLIHREGKEEIQDISTASNKIIYEKFYGTENYFRFLYQLDITSLEVQKISENNLEPIKNAKYSPNGDVVVFNAHGNSLFYYNFASTSQILISNFCYVSDFAISQSGEEIVILGLANEDTNTCNEFNINNENYIYIYNIDSPSHLKRLTPQKNVYQNSSIVTQIDIYANLNDVIYIRELSNKKEMICKLGIDTLDETCFENITFNEIYQFNFDGEDQLLIQARRSEAICPGGCSLADINSDIYLYKIGENKLIKISNSKSPDTDPYWLNSENVIAYHTYVDGIWQISIATIDGEREFQLTNNGFDNYLPSKLPSYYDYVWPPTID